MPVGSSGCTYVFRGGGAPLTPMGTEHAKRVILVPRVDVSCKRKEQKWPSQTSQSTITLPLTPSTMTQAIVESRKVICLWPAARIWRVAGGGVICQGGPKRKNPRNGRADRCWRLLCPQKQGLKHKTQGSTRNVNVGNFRSKNF